MRRFGMVWHKKALWRSKLGLRVAFWLPRWLVYYALVRAGAHAAGVRSKEAVPRLKFMDILRIWEVHCDDKTS